ncbi:MAG TPA: hypothetical protein VGN63_00155 [Flavisolibacter sp.]|nr:hypothetical protein [Flavisolibacter sp.]
MESVSRQIMQRLTILLLQAAAFDAHHLKTSSVILSVKNIFAGNNHLRFRKGASLLITIFFISNPKCPAVPCRDKNGDAVLNRRKFFSTTCNDSSPLGLFFRAIYELFFR